jgi:hypothetical protein
MNLRPLGPCLCPDFKPNVALLNAPFALGYARNTDTYRGYEGKVFKFCPWCGAELQELVVVGSPDNSTAPHQE